MERLTYAMPANPRLVPTPPAYGRGSPHGRSASTDVGGRLDSGTAWLVGSGDYEGLTYYYAFGGHNTRLGPGGRGLHLPGAAPTP